MGSKERRTIVKDYTGFKQSEHWMSLSCQPHQFFWTRQNALGSLRHGVIHNCVLRPVVGGIRTGFLPLCSQRLLPVCTGVTRECAIDGRVNAFRFWGARGRLTGGSATALFSPRLAPPRCENTPDMPKGTKGDIVYTRSSRQPSDKHHSTWGKNFLT